MVVHAEAPSISETICQETLSDPEALTGRPFADLLQAVRIGEYGDTAISAMELVTGPSKHWRFDHVPHRRHIGGIPLQPAQPVLHQNASVKCINTGEIMADYGWRWEGSGNHTTIAILWDPEVAGLGEPDSGLFYAQVATAGLYRYQRFSSPPPPTRDQSNLVKAKLIEAMTGVDVTAALGVEKYFAQMTHPDMHLKEVS